MYNIYHSPEVGAQANLATYLLFIFTHSVVGIVHISDHKTCAAVTDVSPETVLYFSVGMLCPQCAVCRHSYKILITMSQFCKISLGIGLNV